MLCLRSVSRGLYNVLTNNEELIFKEYIKWDFVEGEILLYIVEMRHYLHKVNLSLHTFIVSLSFLFVKKCVHTCASCNIILTGLYNCS